MCVPVMTVPEYAVRHLLPGREIFNKGHLKEVIRNLGSESVWAELGKSTFSTCSCLEEREILVFFFLNKS